MPDMFSEEYYDARNRAIEIINRKTKRNFIIGGIVIVIFVISTMFNFNYF